MNIAAVETWLQEHTGLDASTLGAGAVARVARDRMELLRCKEVESYVALLRNSEEERHALIERVIVPETWFFRDRPALEAVARYVIESWKTAHPGATLRILSAPCSTGEEPYSIVMALALAGWPLERVRIDAVDISRESVGRARAGVYGKNAFRGEDLAFRDAFFQLTAPGEWRVGERWRAPVTFAQGNLLADEFAVERGRYDVVFCRNVLIYFDRATQARAIRTLERLLAPDGWIAVGPAEPVLLFEHGFSAVKMPAAFLLRRGSADDRPVARPKPSAPRVNSPPQVRARPPVTTARVNEVRVPRLVEAAIEAPADTLESIRALADAGRLNEALRRGEALVAGGRVSADLLCVLGVTADAGGNARRAEEYYRKALYLEPRHGEALSHLALLAEKNGDLRAARQLRQRAQRAATETQG